MSKFWKSWFTAYKKKKLFFVNGSARVLEKQMKLKKKNSNLISKKNMTSFKIKVT